MRHHGLLPLGKLEFFSPISLQIHMSLDWILLVLYHFWGHHHHWLLSMSLFLSLFSCFFFFTFLTSKGKLLFCSFVVVLLFIIFVCLLKTKFIFSSFRSSLYLQWCKKWLLWLFFFMFLPVMYQSMIIGRSLFLFF